jgi:hypothetical protein
MADNDAHGFYVPQNAMTVVTNPVKWTDLGTQKVYKAGDLVSVKVPGDATKRWPVMDEISESAYEAMAAKHVVVVRSGVMTVNFKGHGDLTNITKLFKVEGTEHVYQCRVGNGV